MGFFIRCCSSFIFFSKPIFARSLNTFRAPKSLPDQGYGRGVTPAFIGVFEPLARVTLYLTNEMVLAVVLEQLRLPLHGGLIDFSSI